MLRFGKIIRDPLSLKQWSQVSGSSRVKSQWDSIASVLRSLVINGRRLVG